MGEIKWVAGLLLAGLFGFALIMFAINFANDNGSAYTLEEGDGFNSTKNQLNQTFFTFHSDVNTSSDKFFQSEIQEGDTVVKGGQFKVGPGSALTVVTLLISQAFKSVFGSGVGFGVFLTALTSFLALVTFLYIWKVWAGRNPD